MRTDNQTSILQYLSQVEQASLDEIYQNIDFGYYHNGHKHLGNVLSRMVKNRMILRIKKGIFKVNLSPNSGSKAEPENPNQMKLI